MLMQRKEFSENVGLTERQVLRYCELGIFNPERPEGAPNNRRYFGESDLKVAELVHILRKLGNEPVDIQRIFNKYDGNLDKIFAAAIKELKSRVRHDQNLILAAETAQVFGTSLFSFGDMSDEQIDKFASAIRKTNSFKESRAFIRKSSKRELKDFSNRLDHIVSEFSELKDDSLELEDLKAHFSKLEELSLGYIAIYQESFDLPVYPGLLALGMLLITGDGLLTTDMDNVGGEGTAEFVGFSMLLTWIKGVSHLIFPLISLLSSVKSSPAKTEELSKKLYSLFMDASQASGSQDVAACIPRSEDTDDSSLSLFIESVFGLIAVLLEDEGLCNILDISKEQIPSNEEFEYASETLKRLSDDMEGDTHE